MSLAGDLDVVAGSKYFENTGTSTAPAFVQRTGSANPFDDIDIDGNPALADVDRDGTLRLCLSIDKLRPHSASLAGDLDLVVSAHPGGSRTIFNYFENTGTSTAPVFVQRTEKLNPFDSIVVDYDGTPAFADVDGDGKLVQCQSIKM